MANANGKFYVRIGGAVGDVGEIKYGFRAPTESYEGIADELGVVKVTGKDSAKGVAFGINNPRPPKVRINYGIKAADGEELTEGSVTRFCDTDKLGSVLNGSLSDAKIKVKGKEYQVISVSMPGA